MGVRQGKILGVDIYANIDGGWCIAWPRAGQSSNTTHRGLSPNPIPTYLDADIVGKGIGRSHLNVIERAAVLRIRCIYADAKP
jgi:hypothetical protein